MKKLAIAIWFMLLSSGVYAAVPSEVIHAMIERSTMTILIDSVHVDSVSPRVVRIDFRPGTTAAQRRTAAAIAEHADISQPALDAFEVAKRRDGAFSLLSDTSPSSKLQKAMLAVLLDEINELRAQVSLSPRTEIQLRSAIRDKLDAGGAD